MRPCLVFKKIRRKEASTVPKLQTCRLGEKEMNKFYWSKYKNTGPKFNEIQEPSIVRCLLGAAGILALGVLSFVFIVLGLSL